MVDRLYLLAFLLVLVFEWAAIGLLGYVLWVTL
jgi:hypothetical protein